MFTFAELVSLAVSMVSSSKTSVYFREAKSTNKWFADKVKFQIMLTDSSLAFVLDVYLTSFCFEAALNEYSRCWDS